MVWSGLDGTWQELRISDAWAQGTRCAMKVIWNGNLLHVLGDAREVPWRVRGADVLLRLPRIVLGHAGDQDELHTAETEGACHPCLQNVAWAWDGEQARKLSHAQETHRTQ